MSDIGVIVIGRNEGERLRRCLASVVGRGGAVVYVDSSSTDGSVTLARSLGAEVVELDMSLPFSAARARNAGFERLMLVNPEVRYVQFVDGDCEAVAGWIERARAELDARTDVAVICGRRRERFPEASVYNRLADVEWDTPMGEVESCGGDAMTRVEAFKAVGGFDPSVAAGEEPELCRRIRAKGWKVVRIDAEMTLHDSAMLRLGQWCRRAVRSGYGAADVAARFGREGLFARQVRSTRLWAIGFPAAVIATGILVGLVAGAQWGVLASILLALALPAQMLRIAVRWRRRLRSNSDAIAHGILTMLGKWPAMWGEVRYRHDRRRGRNTRLIEYKQLAPRRPCSRMKDPDWQADLQRLSPRPMLKEQSAWALWVYRFGRRNDRRATGLRKRLGDRFYWLLYRATETLTGISIPKSVEVGPGLRIYHFGNIFVHADAKLGAGCTLRQGVTIGNRHEGGPVPVLEDEVDVGAYAQILGGIRVGRGAKIGAMSVVLQDVPPGATAVGIPARIIDVAQPPSAVFRRQAEIISASRDTAEGGCATSLDSPSV
ncbi:MAG TPA: glycosyltransferase family 2 protein [Tepidisphaeraceae bacterium]|jgi:serine acetyltransferase/glycosyltransferase involved in cell wall biosynthesis